MFCICTYVRSLIFFTGVVAVTMNITIIVIDVDVVAADAVAASVAIGRVWFTV